ncbi:hypothetical protein RHSIM_Rhsim03G0260500 [Rhododendron simsii]|uniref:Uncharacterized protein n=1 Tax=Rhododendron simsii TaxID=118357 RepID=A0A834LT91_RHOSS|nr:hypothetical protein RHSIM_Rhsim03G0260500 [Rhododendron simsii]
MVDAQGILQEVTTHYEEHDDGLDPRHQSLTDSGTIDPRILDGLLLLAWDEEVILWSAPDNKPKDGDKLLRDLPPSFGSLSRVTLIPTFAAYELIGLVKGFLPRGSEEGEEDEKTRKKREKMEKRATRPKFAKTRTR